MNTARIGVAATVIALVGVGALSSADAATGDKVILGRSNAATTITTIKNSRGTALALSSPRGKPALSVGGNSAKVRDLNSDLLDGLDATAFQRRVRGACQVGTAVVSVSATGAVSCRSTSLSSMVVMGTVDNVGGGAYCPSGWALGGGGYEQPFIADEAKRDIVRASRPSQQFTTYNGWLVVVDPRAINSFEVNQPTTVYAVCLKAQ